MRMRWKILAALGAFAASVSGAPAEVAIRAVMHSDLKIVDPIWTTAYITRNHGYMVYDTLFAMDEKGEIRPQMVEKYDASADKESSNPDEVYPHRFEESRRGRPAYWDRLPWA